MNEKNRILLVQAPVPGPQNRIVAKSSAIPPLGLGYLASVLLVNGFDIRLIDMDMEDVGVDKFQEILNSFQPDVLGISTTTLTLKNGVRVAKVARQLLPNCIICMGGPHVSVRPQDALRYPFIDVVVCGEGEVTFRELCQAIAEGSPLPQLIPGTVWKRPDGSILKAPPRSRLENLDILPFPARHLMPLQNYNIPGTVITSRGCPFACGFCAGPTVLGRKYTVRSAENVVEEVQMCVDLFHLTSFYFVDDTMTHSTARLHRICEKLKKIKIPPSLDRELKWTCESRADVVSPELLVEMHSAGCTTIQFGMESGSQELLDQLGKKITTHQVEQAVIWSREAGISPVLSMVFPHPNETEATLKETFEFIRNLYDAGAEKIIPSLLTLFPGTRFHRDAAELGISILTEDPDEYNLGTPILTTRYLDYEAIVTGYSQLLLLTQNLGGVEIGGLAITDPEEASFPWMESSTSS